MNPAPTFDRVYAALKHDILDGQIRPGTRLDPAEMAAALAVSVTPVRDALYRLLGERLVAIGGREGFIIPNTTEPDLQDLYSWNQELLLLALRTTGYDIGRALGTAVDAAGMGVAERIAHFFVTIAAVCPNREYEAAVLATGERLHAARRVEETLFEDIAGEEEMLRQSAAARDLVSLRRAISTYHRRRVQAASRIVRALHRGSSGI